MKKIFFLFVFCFSFLVAKEEKKIYLQLEKETNGGYVNSLIVEDKKLEGFLLDNDILKLNFTAPRSNFKQINHYDVEYSRELGYQSRDVFVTFSLDLKYYFEANDKKVPEGFEFGNTLKIGICY